MDPRPEKFLFRNRSWQRVIFPFFVNGEKELNFIFEGIKLFFFPFFLCFNYKFHFFDSWLSLNLFQKSRVFWHALKCSLQHGEREGEEGEGRGQHDCHRQGRSLVSCCKSGGKCSRSRRSFRLLFARTSDPDSVKYMDRVWSLLKEEKINPLRKNGNFWRTDGFIGRAGSVFYSLEALEGE